MGLFRRLVREALAKIAVENGGSNLEQKMGAEGDNRLHAFRPDSGGPLATPPETMRGLHHFQTLIAADDRPLCCRRQHDLRIRVLKDPSAHAVSESRICRLEGAVCECLPSAN
jgi:hypothetical protein